MLVYFATCFCSMILAVCSEKCKERSKYLILAFASMIPFVIIAAIRKDVGTDYSSYVQIFENAKQFIPYNSREPLFNILNYLLARITKNFYVYSAIITFIFCLLIFSQVYNESPLIYLSIFLFLGQGYYLEYLNIMRQMLGIALLFYSVRFINERKIWLFIVCVIAASGIHNTCIVFLIAYPLSLIEIRPKYAVLVLLAVALTKPLLLLIMKAIIAITPYAHFIGSVYDNGASGTVATLIDIVILLLASYSFCSNKKYTLLYNCQLLVLCLDLFHSALPFVGRISMMFRMPGILLIPTAIGKIENKIIRIIIIAGVMVCFSIYIYIRVAIKQGFGVLPYKTFWM